MDAPQPVPAKPYKRRVFIIKKSFQIKIVALVTGAVAVAIGLIAIDMFTSLGRYVSESQPGFDVKAIYQDSAAAFIVRAFIYLLGITWVGVMISHRIAGPLYRFEKSAEEVASGNLAGKVFLRQGDELGDLREVFNDMVLSINGKVSADVAAAGRAQKALEEIVREGASPATVQKAKAALSEVEKIGRAFKLI